MKKRITLNPIIAVVLVLAIAIVTAFFIRRYDANHWIDIKTVKDHFNKQFQGEFSSMLDGFSYRYETDEDKLRLVADISAHSYSTMSLFPYTAYANNTDLNDVVYAFDRLSILGRIFEAVDEETVSDLMALSHDLNNRDLARKIGDKLSKQLSEQLAIVNKQ